MTDEERRRLAGIRESCYIARRFPDGCVKTLFTPECLLRADLDWLLALARRCDLAEAELVRVAPSLAMRGRCGYRFEVPSDSVQQRAGGARPARLDDVAGRPLDGEVRAARLAGYDGTPCPRCGLRRRVSSAGEWACDACGARGTLP